MKESPQSKKLEEILRSSKLVADGFMGDDSRSLCEIIDNDFAEVSKAGFTVVQLANRMQEITTKAKERLGGWAEIDKKLQARVYGVKGGLVCPWPHPGTFVKRVTTVKIITSGETISWSDLNIHMIAQHGFFEGHGSAFRIEPGKLIRFIF